MSAAPIEDALRAFAAADLDGWSGLPEVAVDVLARHLSVATDVGGRGRLGAELHPASWVAIDSHRFESGLRAWVDQAGRVLLLEGRHPVADDGEPLTAPELGVPDRVLPARLGRLTLDGAERVHGSRGLAVQINPENGLLLAAFAFAPTDAASYVATLRPEHATVRRPPVQLHQPGGSR